MSQEDTDDGELSQGGRPSTPQSANDVRQMQSLSMLSNLKSRSACTEAAQQSAQLARAALILDTKDVPRP